MASERELLDCDAEALLQHFDAVRMEQSTAAARSARDQPAVMRFSTAGVTIKLPIQHVVAMTGTRFLNDSGSRRSLAASRSASIGADLDRAMQLKSCDTVQPLPLRAHREEGHARCNSSTSSTAGKGSVDISPTGELLKSAQRRDSGTLPISLRQLSPIAPLSQSEVSSSTRISSGAAKARTICIPEEDAPAGALLLRMYAGSVPASLSVQQGVDLLETCGYVCDAALSSGFAAYLSRSRGTASSAALLTLFAAAVQQQLIDEVAAPLAAWLADERHDGALAASAAAVWQTVAGRLTPMQCLALAGQQQTCGSGSLCDSGALSGAVSSTLSSAGGVSVRGGSAMQCLLVYAAARACDTACCASTAPAIQQAWVEAVGAPMAGAVLPAFLASIERLCNCRRACIELASGSILGSSTTHRLQSAPFGQPVVLAEGERVAFVTRVPFEHAASGSPAWTQWAAARLAGCPMRWRLKHRVRRDAGGTRALLLSFEYEGLQPVAHSAAPRHFRGQPRTAAGPQLSVMLGCVREAAVARVEAGFMRAGEAVGCGDVEEEGVRGELFAVDRGFKGSCSNSFAAQSALSEDEVLREFVEEGGTVLMFAEVCITA